MSFRELGNPLHDVPSVVKIGLVIIEKENYPLPFVNWTNCSWEDEYVKIRTDGR